MLLKIKAKQRVSEMRDVLKGCDSSRISTARELFGLKKSIPNVFAC